MTKPIITINELDAERLDALLEQPAFANTDVAAALNDELDRAEILPPEKMPAKRQPRSAVGNGAAGRSAARHARRQADLLAIAER